MRKVLVIGPGGSGKSTFARRLGELLEIQVKHLDAFYWRAGWTKPSNEDWVNTVTELASGDAWIMDGNFGGTLELRLKHCDTIIFLDMPRLLCLWRVTKRRLRYRNRSRPDMAEGCPEKVDLEFIDWIWNYSRTSRPKVVRLLNEHSGSKQVVWLRSNAEVERFLHDLSLRGAPDGQT
ncbi:MAG TPA: DNA topology modulation protein [Pyrinomonadaceae bacterium]|nr:DNA topology modulation protein [Pyrinomonadaceae bacterium]